MDMARGDESAVLTALSDAELIALSINGSDRAFEVLLTRHSSSVAGYLFTRVPTGVESEDLMQDIFVTAHAGLPKLRNRNRFGPWLMKIAKNRLFDTARTRRRLETEAIRQQDNDSGDSALNAVASAAADPRSAAESAETMARFEEAIGAISEKYRVVLYLRLIEQLEPREIEQRLGLSGSATRVRIHRGLKALTAELKSRGIID